MPRGGRRRVRCEPVISVTVDLQPGGYDEARGRVFYQELLDAVRADGGIESATLAARPA